MIFINQTFVDAKDAMQRLNLGREAYELVHIMADQADRHSFSSVRDFQFEVKLRSEIVRTAHELYQSKASFATFYGSKCNQQFWTLTNEGGFLLKNGVPAVTAINDIYTNGEAYAFECATAMMIVLFQAVSKVIPTTTYNRIYSDLYLWDWHQNDQLHIRVHEEYGSGTPGDIRYFKNPAVDPRTPQWQGENVIQLYDGQFYGHGVGIMDAEGIINVLNKHRRPGADASAYLMNRASRPLYNALHYWSHQESNLVY